MNPIWNVVQQFAVTWRTPDRLVAHNGPDDRDDWQTAAQELFLGRATDAADVERRQRQWDRDEANAYAMSGWR